MYSETLTFLLKPVEKAALEALAEDDSASQASVIRRLIRQTARKRGLWPETTSARNAEAEPWWQSREDRVCAHCKKLTSWRALSQCEQCKDIVCHDCILIGQDGELYCPVCAGIEEPRD